MKKWVKIGLVVNGLASALAVDAFAGVVSEAQNVKLYCKPSVDSLFYLEGTLNLEFGFGAFHYHGYSYTSYGREYDVAYEARVTSVNPHGDYVIELKTPSYTQILTITSSFRDAEFGQMQFQCIKESI